jgi:hypothetical protein
VGPVKAGNNMDENEGEGDGRECERQVINFGERYRDIGGTVVGNGADRAIIVVVLPVVVVMEGDQQNREQHKDREHKRDQTPMWPDIRETVPHCSGR